MNAARLRVGFLSAVRHAIPYAEILAGLPSVELVGVAEEATAPAWIRADSAAAASRLGIPYTQDIAGFLAAEPLDAVIVCSEPIRHARLALATLGAGHHVLIDKPVATSTEELDALEAAAARAPGTLSVINRSLSPAMQRMRQWVDAGHLGLPLHVDVEWFASGAHFSTSVERPELVVDPALSGGGELLNFLIYPIDYIHLLTGLEVVEVYCQASTLFVDAHRQAGVEDCAVLSLLLENGVTATVTLGRVPAAPGLGPVSATVRVLGSHGNASSDDDRPQVLRFGTDGGVTAKPVDGPSSTAILERFLAHWAEALRAGRTPGYGIADARRGVEATLAAYESVRTGQPVRAVG